MIPPPTELRQRGGDPDQHRLSAREPLADPAPHEERHEERVLAPVRRQNLLLRSEEHTSELQSLAYLVCRLLLEKKKKKMKYVSVQRDSANAHMKLLL